MVATNGEERTQDRPKAADKKFRKMGDVSAYIEEGTDPFLALDENHISDSEERSAVEEVISSLQRLHDLKRDHIWAYYTRNMVRPVALSRARVDVVIGNPPWINYNQTFDILRTELENLIRNRYGIWAGGRYATHQDVAGLFFARSVDLYLRDGGVIGFVLPHSALQAGQYSKWRTGRWRAGRYGVGVREDDGDLKDKLDKAIADMKEDGSLNALIEKWFGPEAEKF